MLPIVTKILGLIPGVGTLLDKFTGGKDNSEAEKIKAEAELADIKGFHKTGRVSAKHFWSYTKSFLAIVLVVYLGAALFFPDLAHGFDDVLGSIVDGITKLFSIQM